MRDDREGRKEGRKRSCLDCAYGLLARRDHTIHELRVKLLQREYPADEVEAAIEKLAVKGYLNDARYARSWGRGRVVRTRIGPARLKLDLLRKGFADELIERVVDEVYGRVEPADADQWIDRPPVDDEEAVAAAAAEKKIRTFKPGMEINTKRRKLYDYLARRGFAPEVARRMALDRFDELADDADKGTVWT